MKKQEFTVAIADVETKLYVIALTSDVKSASEKYSHKAFFQAITDGLPLTAEVERILRQKNLWDSDENQKQTEASSKRLRQMEVELRSAKRNGRRLTKDEGKAIAFEMRRERQNLRSVGQSLSNLFNNTAESVSENERMQYWVFASTYRAADNSPYWKTFEDYKADDSTVSGAAASNFLQLMMGIDKDYEKNLYEVQWLIRMGFADAQGRLINSEGKLVDEEGRLIDDKGNWIDAAGSRVDAFGNIINDQGQLVVEDGWAEAV